jgi:ribonuclease T2
LIQELKINLKGTIAADVSVSELLLAAQETTIGCPEGIVDPAGLQ